jgi:hypothetical protein
MAVALYGADRGTDNCTAATIHRAIDTGAERSWMSRQLQTRFAATHQPFPGMPDAMEKCIGSFSRGAS